MMKLILLQGYASGSFGPTTAGRMDSYVEQFQAAGGSKIMLAKGNRSKQVVHTYYTKKTVAILSFYVMTKLNVAEAVQNIRENL